MSNFINEFMESMGGEVSQQISGQLGIDSNTASDILSKIVPLVMGGLKRQKDEPDGEQRVDQLLNEHGNTDLLSNLSGLFSSSSSQKNDPGMGGFLGDAGVQAASALAKTFNLDSNAASQLIPMITTVVFSFLSQKRDSGGGLSGITALLDRDGDGSVLDDVAGFLMNSGGQSGTDLLGGLLGNMFGKKS